MKSFKSRVEDSTFELNLAPMLDIIVSIVPMLLLSVAFVQITVIETPIPQVVEQAIAATNEKNQNLVQIALSVSKAEGFRYTVTRNGETSEKVVALNGGSLDFARLQTETVALKRSYPDVFRLELNPEESIPLNDIVAVMDTIRAIGPKDQKVIFNDVKTGQPIETNLAFPDVVFGNVAGG